MDNTFLREAIEKIEELTDSAREPHVVKIAGKTYCDKSMSRYDREEFTGRTVKSDHDHRVTVMETVKFTVPGAPKGKARARTVRSKKGGTFSYTPEGTMLYENLIKCCYRQESNNIVFNDGQPLKVTIIAYYPIVKSTSKKKKQQMLEDLMFPTKKPDIDNIAKSILDALNKLAYRDDTQVVTLHMEKHYAENPRVEVEIEEIK